MREIAAIVRAQWMVALTYRTRMLFNVGGLLVGIIPIFFISRALEAVAAETILGEGSQLFAFLVVGTVALVFVTSALGTLPGAIGSGISTGTWESLLATPARVWGLLAGLSTYDLLWNVAKSAVLLTAASALGARIEWSGFLLSAGILVLIVLGYLAIGVMAGALVLAFRSTTPLPRVVLIASVFLGGVYYPTSAIPDSFQVISNWIPLTYGLRALRRSLLEGWRFSQLLPDLEMLILFDAVLMMVAGVAFAVALRYARRSGTLTQY